MDVHTRVHPTDEDLRAFLHDDEQDPSAIALHIDNCSDCQARLEELYDASEDRLAAVLRKVRRFSIFNSHDTTNARESARGGHAITDLPALDTERYEIRERMARGGMGEVLRGRDTTLHREVVFKVMLPKFRGQKEATERFITEARVGGRLQHPGIVPVHDVGTFPDGRPFISMKLVHGRTLKELLDEEAAPSADEHIEKRQRLLSVFGRICQAVAYAHAQGVIHRDLKPQNVMVGKFGEVQVMDWGLAKVIAQPDAKNASDPGSETEQLVEADGGAHDTHEWDKQVTRAGDVMGTPAYMPPEQARGQHKLLDERVDVFALGAILCEILTGAPPYDGHLKSPASTQAAADLADTFTRLDETGAEPKLLDLAKRCLDPNPDARPPDAGALDEAMTSYFQFVERRLRQAELDRTKAETKAQEESKRRRITLALAVALLALACVGSVGAFLIQKVRNERERLANETVFKALQTAEQGRAKARLAAPYQNLDEAKIWDYVEDTVAHAEELITPESNQHLAVRLETLKQEVRLEADAARRTAASAENSRRILGLLEDAKRRRTQKVPGEDRLGNQEFSVTETYRAALGQCRIEVGRTTVEDAAAAIRGLTKQAQAEITSAIDIWIRLARNNPEKEPHTKWLKELVFAIDDDPFRARIRKAFETRNKSRLLALAKDPKTVEEDPQTLLLLVEELRAIRKPSVLKHFLLRAYDRYPDDFWVCWFLAMRFKPDDGDSLRYLSACAAIDPENLGVQSNIGIAMRAQGRKKESFEHFRRLVEKYPNYAPGHSHLAYEWYEKDDLDRAKEHAQTAVSLNRRILRPQLLLAKIHSLEGNTGEAIRICSNALKEFPSNADIHSMLAVAYLRQDSLTKALAAVEDALSIDPKHSEAIFSKAVIAFSNRNMPEAIRLWEQADKLKPNLIEVHRNLAMAYFENGDYEQSVKRSQRAFHVDTKLGNLVMICRSLHRLGEFNRSTKELESLTRGLNAKERAALIPCVRGFALTLEGKDLELAMQLLKQGHASGKKLRRWKYPSARWIQACAAARKK